MSSLFKSFKLVALTTISLVSVAQAQDHNHTAHSKHEDQPWSMADQYYDPQEMAASRAHLQHHHGDKLNWIVMGDRLETQFHDGEETFVWDGQGYIGGDINKLYIKTEGEYSVEESEIEDAEIQLLWSRAVSTFWDVQGGLRYDIEPDGQAYGVLGFQGLAPYLFEVDSAAYLSEDGDVTASVEAEYELLFTQRLILQPRIEANFSFQDIAERELGSGLTNLDAGLRLRYEIKREFAPYFGVEWQSAFGETADLIEANGGDKDQTVFVLGLRAWF